MIINMILQDDSSDLSVLTRVLGVSVSSSQG
jgi:hypothetical protein